MKLALSVPSGFHGRELLLPLKSLLEADRNLEKVTVISPAAPYHAEVFSSYGRMFDFVTDLDDVTPDIIVTTTSGLDVHDIPILHTAKKRGIKTVTFIASWDNVWKMERFNNQGRTQVLADRLIVWNEMMKTHLERIFPDYNPQHIAVIGAPRFDYFWHTDRIPSEGALRRYLDMPHDDRPLIHIATTELYPMDYLIKTIAEAHVGHLYASVHPGGDMSKHQVYAQKYGVTVRFSFGRREHSPHPAFKYNPTLDDIYMLVALFKYSDLLVNHSSTVAIESMATDVPIINVQYGKAFDWWRWYRSMVYRDFQQHYRDITDGGATTIITSERQLLTTLTDYLAHPEKKRAERKTTLKKLLTTVDGTASQKVWEYIKQVCAA